jgi:hypothetical protein
VGTRTRACLVPAPAPLGETWTKESTMSQSSPFDKPLQYSTGLKFAEMTRTQKWVFAAKLVACIGTFGFAFPNVQND